MSIEKNMNTRIQHKHDTEANWNKALNFVPKSGEIIIYDIDENYKYSRFKIGDGVRTINNIEFSISDQISEAIANIEIPDKVYVQNEEPVDAEEGALWLDLDEEEKDEASMIATDEDVLEFVMEMGYANPIINDSNGVYIDNYNNVYIL